MKNQKKNGRSKISKPTIQRKRKPRKSVPQPSRSAAPVRNAPAVRSGRAPGLLGGIGRAVGSAFGLGGLGESAGNWLGRITGMGAYRINSNSLSSGPPLFGPTGSLRFKHREYLTDITGSTTFTNSTYSINPGLFTTFPFLSALAQNYQEYRMHGLVFYFNSTSADALNSTNTALGTVILSTNYNSLEPAFTSKVQMEAYEFTNSANPSVSQIHPIECAPKQNVLGELYVRTGNVESGADQRLYDLGLFQIATIGMQAASNIGELWVSYDVELLKPKLPDQQVQGDVQWAHIQESAANTASAAAPLGTSGGKVVASSTLPITTTNTTFTLPYAGQYTVFYSFRGSASGLPSITFGSNITNINLISDDSTNFSSGFNGGNCVAIYCYNVAVSSTSAANVVTIGSGSGQSAGQTDIFINALPAAPTITLNKYEQTIAGIMEKLNNLSSSKLSVSIEEDTKSTTITPEGNWRVVDRIDYPDHHVSSAAVPSSVASQYLNVREQPTLVRRV